MTAASSSAELCGDCGAEVAAGLLACPGCARLIHGDRLRALCANATQAEHAGDLTAALGAWRSALMLLPRATQQHATIEARMQALSAAIDGRGPLPEGAGGARKSGTKAGVVAGVGAAALVLLKSKALLGLLLGNGKLLLLGLLKVPTLLSMLLYARWMSGAGVGFGLGLVASIYVHEIGHVAALRRYGISASSPMFVPGLGAFVRMNQYPTDAHEEARTGLAGPLWGLCAALAAAAGSAVLASPMLASVASLGATVNLFNLIPVWQLDGARGLRALSRRQRHLVAMAGVASALVLHQWMPAIVGVTAFARAFGADVHPQGDPRMCALFALLLAVLSLVATLPVHLPV